MGGKQNKPTWAEMDKEKGQRSFNALPGGSLNKTTVIYMYCQCELSCHRNTSGLKYHLLTSIQLMQTMLYSLQQRRTDNFARNNFSMAIANWLATARRVISTVEDEGPLEIICIIIIICVEQAYLSTLMLIRVLKT